MVWVWYGRMVILSDICIPIPKNVFTLLIFLGFLAMAIFPLFYMRDVVGFVIFFIGSIVSAIIGLVVLCNKLCTMEYPSIKFRCDC
jgi:hypothetical protein